MIGLCLALLSAMALVHPAPRPLIVAFGDSLTSGRGIGENAAYPAILQRKIDAAGLDYEVVNAGVSGDTSSRALARLDRALDGNVRILIVALGANDGLRGVPVDRLKENLSRVIEAAQDRGIQVLLCGMEALPNPRVGGWNYSIAFHAAFTDLAARYKVPLVPFIMFNVIGNASLMQPDHAHPNAEGARAIAENIWPYLEKLLAPSAARP
ncbi:MAG TPA: arylesterase [Vicinamibacterales bacterium]|nr:arylesterase [Vicinamibacterales bacterium]